MEYSFDLCADIRPPVNITHPLVLHVPHQLSSFSPFNYSCSVKIVVSTIRKGGICGPFSLQLVEDVSIYTFYKNAHSRIIRFIDLLMERS